MRIRGISLRVHSTWFVILGLITVIFSRGYRATLAPDVSDALVWLISVSTALLLFLSVVLHELGHSFVALMQGVRVRSITLFFLGGVANTESECRTARGEFLMAAAGPAVSLVLAGGLLLLAHPATHLSPALGEMTKQLGWMNLVLAAFNLLPGLPLDGGRILKAAIWQLTGNQRRGVEVANNCGRFLAFLALVRGVMMLLNQDMGGLWLLMLGWLGLGAAHRQQQDLLLQRLLSEMRVQDAAKRRFRVLEADDALRAVSQMRLAPVSLPGASASAIKAEGEGLPDWLLVCDRGRWKGVIDEQPLKELPVQRWDQDRVGDHMRSLSTLPAIAETAPLWQAVLALRQSAHPRLLVLSPAGLPTGTVERPDVGEAVLARMGVKVPELWLAKARQLNAYPPGLPLESVAQSMADANAAGSGGSSTS
jgi:Zn-dependent protease